MEKQTLLVKSTREERSISLKGETDNGYVGASKL